MAIFMTSLPFARIAAQRLYVGANYHPHDLTIKEWKRDIALMKTAGFNVVRMGHLAWDSYETSDGKFNFVWFDTVMNMMQNAGIKVILDIAIRPAPVWLHQKYPSIDVAIAMEIVSIPIIGIWKMLVILIISSTQCVMPIR